MEVIPASTALQHLGATGAVGDFISHIIVVPTSNAAGAVTLIDGGISIVVFAGGTDSITSLIPFSVPLGMKATSAGGWDMSTGAGLSVIAVGRFT